MRGSFIMNRRLFVVALALFVGMLLALALAFLSISGDDDDMGIIKRGRFISSSSDGGSFPFLHGPHRKLLLRSAKTKAAKKKEPERWGERCTKEDIVITQGPTGIMPNGIPTYTVEIMNACETGCNISEIHLNCGWFSSAHLINHKILKRLSYNDCLVNEGKPLVSGGTLKFQYANTFLYPLTVSSVVC
ncbi:hypothetical protein WN944_019218 [Citrus x changshan-huyou]|uniref:Protein TAPETUM DETERMINANT 1 n=3 Tax=Citrus TaxID=2706 RepID=A0ACB8L9A4_CITSI|nr:protein TAPETUM DETERMINANT 1 [Citrus sinensis]